MLSVPFDWFDSTETGEGPESTGDCGSLRLSCDCCACSADLYHIHKSTRPPSHGRTRVKRVTNMKPPEYRGDLGRAGELGESVKGENADIRFSGDCMSGDATAIIW